MLWGLNLACELNIYHRICVYHSDIDHCIGTRITHDEPPDHDLIVILQSVLAFVRRIIIRMKNENGNTRTDEEGPAFIELRRNKRIFSHQGMSDLCPYNPIQSCDG